VRTLYFGYGEEEPNLIRRVALFSPLSGSLPRALATWKDLQSSGFKLNENNYHAYQECLTRCGAWDELFLFDFLIDSRASLFLLSRRDPALLSAPQQAKPSSIHKTQAPPFLPVPSKKKARLAEPHEFSGFLRRPSFRSQKNIITASEARHQEPTLPSTLLESS